MRTLYRSEIIERYKFPRNKGVMKDASVQGEVMNALCGDDLILYLRVDKTGGTVQDASFSAEGCALMQASADILCGYIKGRSLEELRGFSPDDLLKLYGEPPIPSRLKCVLLPYEALKRGLLGLNV